MVISLLANQDLMPMLVRPVAMGWDRVGNATYRQQDASFATHRNLFPMLNCHSIISVK